MCAMLVPSAGGLLLHPPAQYSSCSLFKTGIFSLESTYETSPNLPEHPLGVPAPPSNLADVELKTLKGCKGDLRWCLSETCWTCKQKHHFLTLFVGVGLMTDLKCLLK